MSITSSNQYSNNIFFLLIAAFHQRPRILIRRDVSFIIVVVVVVGGDCVIVVIHRVVNQPLYFQLPQFHTLVHLPRPRNQEQFLTPRRWHPLHQHLWSFGIDAISL